MDQQTRLPERCPKCGSNVVVRHGQEIICCVCPYGRQTLANMPNAKRPRRPPSRRRRTRLVAVR